ncbi:YIEGIA family protein [Garciella nitratireducens]|uniref:YIEGIA protein n=1 Tax=Garciella nitratireducens DSM 15102 TaxID=1121911 RepID=A0A1T4K072_9FIRM|nr:YIEGIA family protein [Garciella nitratireducens]RBP39201.1 hypothetical protein DFR81_11627 [Garciella nitratireducens]SJZ35820.1 hypothetical protein SAMN02745973_00256 [Garciella nitratireducens DSM 15102]
MNQYLPMITISILMGTLARINLLRADYRQYPSYPKGYISHFTFGIIASSLGAVAIPAIIQKDFQAITFLSIAATQFREVRGMERESLENLEDTELVPRGKAYIEDIAKAFESRNYIAMLTAIISSLVIQFYLFFINKQAAFFIQWIIGMIAGIFSIVILSRFTKGKIIEDIADVVPAKIYFKGPLLCIGDITIMNVGFEDSKKILLEKGMAILIKPKDDDAMATLSNIGLRQAIQHNVAVQLGIRKDVDEPDFTPLARRSAENGSIGLFIVAMEPDMECFIAAVKRVPVLESSQRKPLKSYAGKKAAD